MKRILHIVASMDPAGGGVAQAIRTLADALKAYGYVSEAVSVDAPDAPFLSTGRPPDLPIHAVGPGRFGWAYHRNLKMWLETDGRGYDIWIIHGLWLYPSAAALRTAAARTRKVFIFPHGMLDPWFQSWKRRPTKTLRNTLYWHLLESGTVRRADGLLFTCAEERRLASTTFARYRPQRAEVVGLGNADVPAAGESPLSAFLRHCPAVEGQRYLLFLGRIHPKKGLPLLLEGWARAIREAPAGEPLHLVIAGPGADSAHGLEMQALAGRILPEGTVHFPGMLSGSAKWAALRGADAFVLFSHQENFGIAVVEALASGTPVLLSTQVNIWREVVDGGGGLAAMNDREGATKCLQSWFSLNAAQRETARAHARATYLATFSADAAARRLDQVFSNESTRDASRCN
ncbi:MAG: glycosyltransferase [Opitutales bacterium]|nr:glycosyltransferase [Opitutales bacterium]